MRAENFDALIVKKRVGQIDLPLLRPGTQNEPVNTVSRKPYQALYSGTLLVRSSLRRKVR